MADIEVSVIVPIYNVEGFIDRGIKNLLAQTYRKFEIILVDDGSTDGSLDKCNEWAQKDERIKVLHQDNQGSGGARNKGIDNAAGKYIYFFDIDDEISQELLERNVEKMVSYDVDFLLFGYKCVETEYPIECTVSFPSRLICSNDELKNCFMDLVVFKMNGFPWNKFYRKSFLDKHNLRFENQRIQQDEVFNLKVYQYLDKAYISSDVLYTYYIYYKGNTRSNFIPDRFDIYKSVRKHFEDLKSHWKFDDKRLDDYLNRRFYHDVINCMMFNLTHPRCNFSKKQVDEEMDRIMGDPLTEEAFEYAKNNEKGIEQKLYRTVCRNKSMLQIKICVSVFSFLRDVNKIIKRYLAFIKHGKSKVMP